MTPAEYAAASRAEQGLPPTIVDPSILAAVAGMLTIGGGDR